jgi:hypothetical protein
MEQYIKALKLKGFIHNFTFSLEGWRHNGTLLYNAAVKIIHHWCCPYEDQLILICGVETHDNIKGIGLIYPGCL